MNFVEPSLFWFIGNALLQDITCLAADRMLVFASYGSLLHAFARNKEVFIFLFVPNNTL